MSNSFWIMDKTLNKYWINFEMAVNKEILENKLFDEFLVGSSALFPCIFLGKFLFYLQVLKNCKAPKKG